MTLRPLDRLKGTLFRSLRLAFRLMPMPERTRDKLRQRFLDRFQSLVPRGPRGQAGNTTVSHRARKHANEPALGYVDYRTEALPSPLPATLVAFYLPQFHTIPENDAWWGSGFTEWRNVSRALPQFEGQVQPRLPGELGFYDLRNPDIMRRQAKLAREYGVGAFCFYFYWFGGKTLLEAPLDQWLRDASIDLPFCLCWANENWSRRWDGRADDVLIGQQYSEQDDLAFIAHVSRYLRDPRYLRVDGKPLLLVYRPGLLPDAQATARRWREWCLSNGIGEIFIAYTQSFDRADPRDYGFDAAIEFPPNLTTPTNVTGRQRLINPDYEGQVLDWRELAADFGARPLPGFRVFPGVNCGWDNEARRPGRGRTYLHASPRGYRDWLESTIVHRLSGRTDPIVFVNAWNEWAEGAVLEPDARLGYAWLQASRDALRRSCNSTTGRLPSPKRPPCAVIHAWYLDAFEELLLRLNESGQEFRLVVTTTPDRSAQVQATLERHGFSAEIVTEENRGRDILPFLRVADRLLSEGEELVLKLHTKRSPHLGNGEAWRQELVDGLIAQDRAEKIVAAFERDDRLGIVAPEGHLLSVADYLGDNRDGIEYLARRLGLSRDPLTDPGMFVSGSMFWCRLSALRPLLDAHLDVWEFEAECGQIDGTFAHAIERIFGACACEANYRTETAAAVVGDSMPTPTASYAFAKRD